MLNNLNKLNQFNVNGNLDDLPLLKSLLLTLAIRTISDMMAIQLELSATSSPGRPVATGEELDRAHQPNPQFDAELRQAMRVATGGRA
jgi:hypothetical protein